MFPGEGVVVRHRQVELLLGGGVAGDIEVDVAQLGAGCVVGVVCSDPMYRTHGREGKKGTDQLHFHARLLVFRTGRCRLGAGRRFGAQLIRSVNATFACDMSSTRRAAHPVMRLEDRGAQT